MARLHPPPRLRLPSLLDRLRSRDDGAGGRDRRLNVDWQTWDWLQPLLIALLSGIGLAFIYSAESHARGGGFWEKQLAWMVVGFLCYVVAASIHYRLLLKYSHWIYIGSIVLLAALWLTPFGEVRFNARRWLDFGPISFQPSEAGKVGCLVMVSALLARAEVGTTSASLLTLGLVGLTVALPMALIFFQPDLGSTLLIVPMVLALLYVSRLPQRFFLRFMGVVATLAALLLGLLAMDLWRYQVFLQDRDLTAGEENNGAYEREALIPLLKDYHRNRLLSFFAPEAVDPTGTGINYNTRQSLIAVGSGQFWGKGWTEGTQARLGYLPHTVAHNDFIFSVLAEEVGFVGGFTVLALYALLLWRGLAIASQAGDRFGVFLAVGITVIFAVHLFVNVGMVLGLMPVKGMPLPFLSYGGSFLLICCVLQGVLQSVYRHRRAHVR